MVLWKSALAGGCLLGAAAIAGLFGWRYGGSHTAARPGLWCDQPTKDLGEVAVTSDDRQVSHRFTLTNTSARPISITRYQSNCGCTVAKLSSPLIEPGASQSVLVDIILKQRSPHTFDQQVLLDTDSPDTPKLVLRLHGIAVAEVHASLERVHLGEVDHGQQAVGWSVIRSRAAAPMTIESLSTSDESFIATLEAIDSSGTPADAIAERRVRISTTGRRESGSR